MKKLCKGTGYWVPDAQECDSLTMHLKAEIPGGHVLWAHMKTLRVIARAKATDDVVVETGDANAPFAIVHMTWRGRPEIAPFFPETVTFSDKATLRDALLERSAA